MSTVDDTDNLSTNIVFLETTLGRHLLIFVYIRLLGSYEDSMFAYGTPRFISTIVVDIDRGTPSTIVFE